MYFLREDQFQLMLSRSIPVSSTVLGVVLHRLREYKLSYTEHDHALGLAITSQHSFYLSGTALLLSYSQSTGPIVFDFNIFPTFSLAWTLKNPHAVVKFQPASDVVP